MDSRVWCFLPPNSAVFAYACIWTHAVAGWCSVIVALQDLPFSDKINAAIQFPQLATTKIKREGYMARAKFVKIVGAMVEGELPMDLVVKLAEHLDSILKVVADHAGDSSTGGGNAGNAASAITTAIAATAQYESAPAESSGDSVYAQLTSTL